MENIYHRFVVFRNAIDSLEAWGTSWRIAFEPSKSQAMTIDLHHQPWHFTPLEFAGVPITEELLGVTFDCQLSYRRHLCAVAVRARQRLGLLRKASPLLDPRSCQTVYCWFLRPVMKYCPQVWMGMADCHLRRLDQTQRLALNLIGPGALLQSLSIRRMVAACTFLFKLLRTDLASPLRQVLPPSQAPGLAHVHPTRRSLSRLDMHPYQFETGLPIHCRESCFRSFPHVQFLFGMSCRQRSSTIPMTVKGCKLSVWLSSGISLLSVGTGPRASCNLA